MCKREQGKKEKFFFPSACRVATCLLKLQLGLPREFVQPLLLVDTVLAVLFFVERGSVAYEGTCGRERGKIVKPRKPQAQVHTRITFTTRFVTMTSTLCKDYSSGISRRSIMLSFFFVQRDGTSPCAGWKLPSLLCLFTLVNSTGGGGALLLVTTLGLGLSSTTAPVF